MDNANFHEILNRIRESIFSLCNGELCIKENIDLAADQRKIPSVHIGHLQIDVGHSKGGDDIDARS